MMRTYSRRPLLLVLFLLCQLGYLALARKCNDQTIFKVLIQNPTDVRFYKELLKRPETYNVTIDREVRELNQDFVFRTNDCVQDQLIDILENYHFQYTAESYQDYAKRLEQNDQKARRNLRRMGLSHAGTVGLGDVTQRYLSSEEINLYVEEFASLMRNRFPDIETTVTLEGNSYEGRQIKSVSVGYRNRNNPIVFIDAGIHAREWQSRSLALYILYELVNEAELGEDGLLSHTSVVVLPNCNPDGYDYSQKHDKMWRKTRKPVADGCVGVDGNRNFDILWLMGEAENDPCQEVYKGVDPFSEQETRIMRDIMYRVKDNCFLYITIHTYGNSLIYPYGYTNDAHPNKALFHQVAMAGVNAVRQATGTVFKADQSGTQLYLAAGGSDDYAVDIMKIPVAITLELGEEKYGFQVPTEVLEKTLIEGWIATKAMILEARKLHI